jgi:hypothetical protein
MDEKKLAKLKQLKKLKETHMVGEGKVDRLKTHMGGKTKKGFTEHIDDKMRSPGIEEFKRREAERRMIKDIEGDAIRERNDMQRRKLKKQALRGAGSLKGIPGKAGKLVGKLPILGTLMGPAITMALGGTPNDALASALDSDNLGEGTDQVGDMGLSNADRLMAERRALEGMKERKLEEMPDTMADVRKRDRGIMKTADMDMVDDIAKGRESYKDGGMKDPKLEALKKLLGKGE